MLEQDCLLPGNFLKRYSCFIFIVFFGIFMALGTFLGDAVELHNLLGVLLGINCSST